MDALPALAGYANNTTGIWTLQAAGSGVGSTSDQFNFASEPASGSFALVALTNYISDVAGIMIRSDANANKRFSASSGRRLRVCRCNIAAPMERARCWRRRSTRGALNT